MHSHEGDPGSINAWVRVYEEDALAAAAQADERLGEAGVRRDGPAPPLTGVPIGLKDLYGVAGKPITASSRLLHECPPRTATSGGGCPPRAWCSSAISTRTSSPRAGRPTRSGARGRSNAPPEGRAAARRRRSRRERRRGDGDRHRRVAAHPLRVLRDLGDEADPRAGLARRGRAARLEPRPCRADGALARGLRAAPGGDGRARSAPSRASFAPARAEGSSLAGARVAVSPRLGSAEIDADVAAGLDRALDACRRLGAELVEPPGPAFRTPSATTSSTC